MGQGEREALRSMLGVKYMTSTQKILANLEERSGSRELSVEQALRKEPWITNGKEESALFHSQMHLPTMRSFCAKNTKKASRCQGALGRRFGRTRPLP